MKAKRSYLALVCSVKAVITSAGVPSYSQSGLDGAHISGSPGTRNTRYSEFLLMVRSSPE
jgi:hypothetical protein